jgi:branched-chain amino acid transport system ATP-binding protein/urea transport system ATP-binding protein
LLELTDVHSGYGPSTVLRGFNLRVGRGEVVAILGRNGAGKTTLLRTIVGAVRIHQGKISFDDQDLGKLPTHERARQGIAYVPQGRDVFPGLTVLENLKAAAYGTKQKGWKEQVDRMLDEFPVLAQKRQQRGGSLSGGQQQILAIARALMTSPRLLLLDEPSEGIQPSIVDQIADTVWTIHEKRGISVILVEQNLDFVEKLASRAYVVDKGQVVGEFPASEFINNKDLQREYLGV